MRIANVGNFRIKPGIRINRITSYSGNVVESFSGNGCPIGKGYALMNENYKKIAKQNIERYKKRIFRLKSVFEKELEFINWEELQYSSTSEEVLSEKQTKTPQKNTLTCFYQIFSIVGDYKQGGKSESNTANNKGLLKDKNLVSQVLKGNRSSWNEVINKIQPFNDITYLGSKVNWTFSSSKSKVTIVLELNKKKLIPNVIPTLTKEGRLFHKKIPKELYNQIYNEYTCNCALRIISDFFSLLPIEETEIEVYDEIPTNDSQKQGCIFTLKFTRLAYFSLIGENNLAKC